MLRPRQITCSIEDGGIFNEMGLPSVGMPHSPILIQGRVVPAIECALEEICFATWKNRFRVANQFHTFEPRSPIILIQKCVITRDCPFSFSFFSRFPHQTHPPQHHLRALTSPTPSREAQEWQRRWGHSARMSAFAQKTTFRKIPLPSRLYVPIGTKPCMLFHLH